MNNTFKYPNGKVATIDTQSNTKEKDIRRSHLGIDFESLINDSNAYYLQQNIACIYKKPTPVQIVRVDYPARNKARIVEAYYRTPSTTDYNGIYKGKYIDFEAKSCHTQSFSFQHIYVHQLMHLETVYKMGGISFLIIEFSTKHEVFVLPTPKLIALYYASLKGERKSIPYSYFKENAYEIKLGFSPKVDYIKAIDYMIENNE